VLLPDEATIAVPTGSIRRSRDFLREWLPWSMDGVSGAVASLLHARELLDPVVYALLRKRRLIVDQKGPVTMFLGRTCPDKAADAVESDTAPKFERGEGGWEWVCEFLLLAVRSRV
jgi:hypothetical protein